jgi:AraC-like DNA-binding protein
MPQQVSKPTKLNFRRFHLALQRLEIDTAPLYRKLGIREKDFHGEAAGISMVRYLELLNLAADQSRRPCLGLSIAQLSSTSDLGIMGYIMRNAPDFEECLALGGRYLQLVSPGAQSGTIKDDATCTWTYDIQGFSPQQCRQDVEMTMMQFVNLVGDLLSLRDWRPNNVYFQHAAPDEEQPLHRFLADQVTFNHFYNGISFPREFLFYPVTNADPRLLKVLENQVQRSIDQLKMGQSLLDRVTFLISSSLGKTEVSADRIASHLGMSRRTLHRRLSERGTSFGELRDTIVSQLAKEILSTTIVSITELAQQLGYSDASAFIRAFKRQTGLTPLDYSRQHACA